MSVQIPPPQPIDVAIYWREKLSRYDPATAERIARQIEADIEHRRCLETQVACAQRMWRDLLRQNGTLRDSGRSE
jgi:hypothetical protein